MKSLLATAAIIAATLLPAEAAPYTLFIYESPDQLALRPGTGAETGAYWAAYDSFGKQLAAAGILRGGSALLTGTPVALVRAGSDTTSAAPYASAPLALGGYFQIDVAAEADAVAWAKQLPVVGGVVEVRAGYPVPGMSM